MSLAGVDLNLLPALDALLAERNVTRAAERLSVGQPAMSAALARLRKQLGDPLLVRQGQGYELSAMAVSLLGPVREAVAAAEAVLGVRAPFRPERDSRTFTVVTSDYVALVLLRPLMAELASEAPGICIVVTAPGPDGEDRLHRGSADLLVYPTDVASGPGDLPHRVLFEDDYVLVADPDNPAVHDDLDLCRLRELSFVALGNAPGLSPVAAQLDSLGVGRHVALTTETLVIVPLLVAGTDLVALVARRLAYAVSTQLRVAPVPVRLRPLVEAMYWSPRSTDDPAHRWLRGRLLEQARRLPT